MVLVKGNVIEAKDIVFRVYIIEIYYSYLVFFSIMHK